MLSQPPALLRPLSDNDVEEQMSLAYLCAISGVSRMIVTGATRLNDNRGVDAHVRAYGPFGPNDGALRSVDIDIQLKATKKVFGESDTHHSFFLDSVDQYDVLRSDEWFTPRILVVLFLPPEPDDWLIHSEAELRLRRCAYWVSLLGAASCPNGTGQTIYLPKNQCLNSQTLKPLCSQLSRRDVPTYQLPPQKKPKKPAKKSP